MRADLTQTASPEVASLRQKYAIKGVPTVVFLDKNGREREELRVFVSGSLAFDFTTHT